MANALNLITLPPPPTIAELVGRFCLTPTQYARVFDGHDPGDEEPRRYALLVCSIQSGRECRRDPNHWGPHEWMRK